MAAQHNTDFLTALLLDENKHFTPIDFISKGIDGNYCCVCVSFGLASQYDKIRIAFGNEALFCSEYFDIYTTAVNNYWSIVGGTTRQILVDEARIFYPQLMDTFSTTNLVSNTINKQYIFTLLAQIAVSRSCMIVLRDENAFIVIHYEGDDYLIIDPHVEFCGILSSVGIYKYIVYDSIWDFDVHVLIPSIPADSDVQLAN